MAPVTATKPNEMKKDDTAEKLAKALETAGIANENESKAIQPKASDKVATKAIVKEPAKKAGTSPKLEAKKPAARKAPTKKSAPKKAIKKAPLKKAGKEPQKPKKPLARKPITKAKPTTKKKAVAKKPLAKKAAPQAKSNASASPKTANLSYESLNNYSKIKKEILDITRESLEYNLEAMNSLMKAKSFSDILKLQREFSQNKLKKSLENTRRLAEIYTKNN